MKTVTHDKLSPSMLPSRNGNRNFYPMGVDWNSLLTEDESFHYQSASGSVEINAIVSKLHHF